MEGNKEQRGTALIVTILLAGAISLVAFGMTKITLNEVFVGQKTEEGIEAFYAAQAGIEDALMRYKFHDKSSLEIPAGADKDTKSALRVYINRNAANPGKAVVIPNINTSIPTMTMNDYVYDLKVWSKQHCNLVSPCEWDIEKDKSIELDVSEAQSVNVKWNVYDKNGNLVAITNDEEQKNTALWYRISDGLNSDPRSLGRDFFTMMSYYQRADNPPNPPAPPIPKGGGNISLNGANKLKFRAFITETINGQAPAQNLVPLRIKITINPIPGNIEIGGPETYIESTGYYGDTAKKIVTTVDRDSKSIIDVFDYVIYSGRGPLPR